MKIKFKVIHEDGSKPKLTVKTNKKFVHEITNNMVFYKMVNCLNVKSIVVIGSLNDKDYYWCTTIPFKYIYDKYPLLKSDSDKFNKKGFHKKILEALCANHVEPAIKNITPDNFINFITPKEDDAKSTRQTKS